MRTTTKYIWDEDNLLAETDVNNVVQTVYTNEPQQYGNLISTRLPIAGTPTTAYHHFDAIGSTRKLTNAVGGTTDTMVYDAWGNVVNRTGTTGANLLWIGEAGYYFDAETGLVYIRERVYGPATARWTAVEPLALLATLIKYLYALNSPLIFTDPSGLFCQPQPINQDTGCDPKKDCETCLEAKGLYPQVAPKIECVEKMKCNYTLECLCCGNTDSVPTGKASACTLVDNADVVRVSVCCQGGDPRSTMAHELAHVIRLCRLLSKKTMPLIGSCHECLREELLAHICESGCETPVACVIAALASCGGLANSGILQSALLQEEKQAQLPLGKYKDPCIGITRSKKYTISGCTKEQAAAVTATPKGAPNQILQDLVDYVKENFKMLGKSKICSDLSDCKEIDLPDPPEIKAAAQKK